MKCTDFIKKAADVLRKRASLAGRYEAEIKWLSNREKAWSANRIRIGVLGVTSSGKSTLINAVLGKELLSSAVKPSSSQLVHCTKGTPVRAVISFEKKTDKTLEGAALSKEEIKQYSDEECNQGNKEGVTGIRIQTPLFEFGDDVELVDSAGLDAYKLESHEKLSMEVLLPTIDMCVFVTTLKANSDEKTKNVLDAVAKHNCPLVIVQNMLDSIEPKPDGSKTKEMVAEELKKRLERIIERSDIKEKKSVHVVQMSALYAQDKRCHGKTEQQESRYEEFKTLIGKMIGAVLPKIDHERCESLYARYRNFISNEEKSISGKVGRSSPFEFEGVKEKLYDVAKDVGTALETEVDRLSQSHIGSSISEVKREVNNCENRILYQVSNFNEYISSVAKTLNTPIRDIVVDVRLDSISEPSEIYKTKISKKRVEQSGIGGGISRVFGTIFSWFGADTEDWGYEYESISEQVLDETRTVEEMRKYMARARQAYTNTIHSWFQGIKRTIANIDKEIDNAHISWKQRQEEIKSIEDVQWAISEIKKLVPENVQGSLDIHVDFSQDVRQNENLVETPVSGYQTGIWKLSTTLMGKVFSGTVESALRAADAPENINIVIAGWDSDSLRDFVFRFFTKTIDLDSIEETKQAEQGRTTVRFNPDERFFRIWHDKKEAAAFFIMVNAQQHGSAKNQISKLKLNEVLKSLDKVFFVVQDFHSIVNSRSVSEMRLNMKEYFNEFVPENNRGFLLINADNPVYSMAYLESQIRPCSGQSDELEMLDLLQKNFQFLFKDKSRVSGIIGDLIRSEI